MISGWMLKVVLCLVALGFAVIELGSPLIARAQADDAAHQVANTGALTLFDTRNFDAANAEAAAKAVETHVELASFGIAADGDVEVVVRKEARSLLLHRFGPTRRFYEIAITAESTPRRGL